MQRPQAKICLLTEAVRNGSQEAQCFISMHLEDRQDESLGLIAFRNHQLERVVIVKSEQMKAEVVARRIAYLYGGKLERKAKLIRVQYNRYAEIRVLIAGFSMGGSYLDFVVIVGVVAL
ncbi:MAG: hypothetical protein Q9171_002337 [Xanthocarpia ochracea]